MWCIPRDRTERLADRTQTVSWDLVFAPSFCFRYLCAEWPYLVHFQANLGVRMVYSLLLLVLFFHVLLSLTLFLLRRVQE